MDNVRLTEIICSLRYIRNENENNQREYDFWISVAATPLIKILKVLVLLRNIKFTIA